MGWFRWLRLRLRAAFSDVGALEVANLGRCRVVRSTGMGLVVATYSWDNRVGRALTNERVIQLNDCPDKDQFAICWLSRNGWKCPKWGDGSSYDFR